MRLSLATIALNEERLIGGMLSSLGDLADEIIIGIDSRTTDNTAAIVAKHGGRTFEYQWPDDFSAARNLTLDKASGDWILVLDGDEILTREGAAIVKDILDHDGYGFNGFEFQLANCDLSGKIHNISQCSIRLFARGFRYQRIIHEVIRVDRPCVVQGPPAIAHCGYTYELWRGRDKQERNRRLLKRQLELTPDDDYIREKLEIEMRLDTEGIVTAQ